MVAYTTIDINRCQDLASSIMNAATGGAYGVGSVNNPLHPGGQFPDAVKICDGIIYAAILQNKQHRLRRLFVTEISIADGAEILDEPVGDVWITTSQGQQPGCEVEPDYVQFLKRKLPTGLSGVTITCDQGFYCWQGQKLFFTGISCRISVIPTTPPSFPMTPLDYELGVVAGMCALLFPTDGEYTEAANHFATMWSKILELIASGKDASSFPEIAFQRVP